VDAAVQARAGCDVQRVADVADAVRDFGERYLDRVYTPDEQQVLHAGGAASLAARFAAKEAVLKVLGAEIGDVDLRWVEIARGTHGRPVVRLSAGAADLARAAGLGREGAIDVSLSHTGDLALAVAVAVPEAPRPPGTPAPAPAPAPAETTIPPSDERSPR
jgi:holo-[acyl-carrier protein] synthase